jgi:hypothetical protein
MDLGFTDDVVSLGATLTENVMTDVCVCSFVCLVCVCVDVLVGMVSSEFKKLAQTNLISIFSFGFLAFDCRC